MHKLGGQREERETQADCTMSIEPDVGLDHTTMRSPPETKLRLKHLTDCVTQVPVE